jgi:O-antigen/teichoic acid export membrane protein
MKPSPTTEPPAVPVVADGGGQARLLASGALMQQAAQASGLVVLLVIITVLARRLTLTELGAYGLVSSLSGYLLVLRNSVASSTIRTLSAAPDNEARARAFSTAAALYAGVGLVTGLVIAGIGALIASGVLSGELQRRAALGALMLGGVTGVGITSTIYLDALRSSMLLTRAAATEILGVALQLAVMLTLILSDVSLTVLIGASGGIPLMSGTLSALVVRRRGLPYRFRLSEVGRASARELVPTAGYLLVVELSNLVIYSLDRVILGVFKSAATVGLYEGPVRTHNVFYAVNNALAVPTLPASSRFASADDRARLRQLVLRGSRYTLALFVPLGVTAIALAGPLLEVWLGHRFRQGDLALSILVSYWLLYGALAVTPALLVGAGRARTVARYMSLVAVGNLALSLALTPALGLEGPALGTAIAYFAAFPFILRLALSVAPVRLSELAREAWAPAYSLGLALAVCLVAVRLAASPHTLPALMAVVLAGLGAYWLAFYRLCLRPDERLLVRDTARSVVGRAQ